MNRTTTTATPSAPLYETFTLSIPKSDAPFFRAMTKKMGWTAKKSRRTMTAYERSLDDVVPIRTCLEKTILVTQSSKVACNFR